MGHLAVVLCSDCQMFFLHKYFSLITHRAVQTEPNSPHQGFFCKSCPALNPKANSPNVEIAEGEYKVLGPNDSFSTSTQVLESSFLFILV